MKKSSKKTIVSAKKATKKALSTKTVKSKKTAKGKEVGKIKKEASAAVLAKAFPMAAAIDEVVHKSVPANIVAKVKSARSKKAIISVTYPYDKMIKRSVYEEQIELLHIELVKMQAWAQQTGERIVLLFEGRDAAGKGGSIKRFTENLNPRGARVVALSKPSDSEKGQWYFQRYVEHMPTKGEIVFFDRSWYNRAGVEKVMGFCTPQEYLEFMRQAPEFERMLVRSGIRLFKFWFSVSREEQLRRFMGRAKDPLKQWKLSPMDVESLGRWDDYTKAKESMLFYTDTADAPWTIVRSDDKKRARLNSIRFLLSSVPYAGKDEKLLKELNRHIVGAAKDIYESDERAPMPIDPIVA
ncbi:polyphosphate kinase 2 [Cerasicoccus arenae]|nr:polyphosphate kinase 2 [Cerasicoccus arenae]MBK1858698.1 polyphosphate kinase 2 [Cerasicoccus arenae]